LSAKKYENLLFARHFFSSPRMLGSAIPSSPFLVRRVLRRVHWDKAKVIVEYGPGVGTFTREILKRMRPDALLLAIESNGSFAEYLRNAIADARLRVWHGSAAEVLTFLSELRIEHADYVISGIPFSTLLPGSRRIILRNTWRALGPEGVLLVYQFSGAVLKHLEGVFGPVECDREMLNVLPAKIFSARKSALPQGPHEQAA